MGKRGAITILLSWGSFLWAQKGASQRTFSKFKQDFFIENKGQWHSDVLYLYRGPGFDAWITRYGLSITLVRPYDEFGTPVSFIGGLHVREQKEGDYEYFWGQRVLINLEGANPQPLWEALDKKSGYYHYFFGKDPSNHWTYAELYGEIRVREVYPGISLRYRIEGGRLQWDFLIASGADPEHIQLRVQGVGQVEVKDQELVISTRFGPIALGKLQVYQGNKVVPVQLVILQEERYKVVVNPRDSTQSLEVSPLLYSTYVGSMAYEVGYGIAVDGDGQAYVVGYTWGPSYSATPGTFWGGARREDWNVFVTKLSASGEELIFTAYLGGSGPDVGRSIAVDENSYIYLTGWTQSLDYPVTLEAFRGTNTYTADVFVTKLSPDGGSLIYSTYLGGSDNDYAYDIAVDKNGHAYITGWTRSNDYPTTSTAFQSKNHGRLDAFVTKLSIDGNALAYSTYIGGAQDDQGYSIAVDESGRAYVTGWTWSRNYPTTPGVFQKANGGGADVFVTKLNTDGSRLEYSTYIGGAGDEYGYGIAVDKGGYAYITGCTQSENYDVTPNAFQRKKEGSADAFVTKLSPTARELVYSTYLGGAKYEEGCGIVVDESGRACIIGSTVSSDYDITPGVFPRMKDYYSDVFVTKLNPSGSALQYSTYLGGTREDRGYAIAMDKKGQVYLTGFTWSIDFRVTPGAPQAAYFSGVTDIFIAKLP